MTEEGYRAAEARRSLNGHKFQSLLEKFLAAYATGKSSAATGPISELPDESPLERPLYRRDNQRWHDILEQVLNDPDEALGIMKNLEWAERTVLEKRRRPAGRLASGE